MQSGRISVVLAPSLPAGHPVLLGGQGAPWRWVALLLPDPHCMILGHDPVIVGPLKEVTLEEGEKREAFRRKHLQPAGRCAQSLPSSPGGPQSQDPYPNTMPSPCLEMKRTRFPTPDPRGRRS